MDTALRDFFADAVAPAGLVRRLVPRLTDGPPGLEALANRFRIEATDRGVARLLLGRGVAAVSPRARRHAAQALEELREYLAGRRAFFAVDVDLADVAPFADEVTRPRGRFDPSSERCRLDIEPIPVSSLRRLPAAAGAPIYAIGAVLEGDKTILLIDLYELHRAKGT